MKYANGMGRVAAFGLATAMTFASLGMTEAAPLPGETAALKAAAPTPVGKAYYRRGYGRGYYGYGRRGYYRRGWGYPYGGYAYPYYGYAYPYYPYPYPYPGFGFGW